MIDLKQNVQYVKGVGPTKVKLLNNIGIYTLEDLLTYFPREYEDRSKITKICDLVNGEETTIEGVIVSEVSINYIRKNMTIIKTVVEDETGKCIVTWFNQTYIKQQLKRGEKYKFFGKVTKNSNNYEMNTPVFEPIGINKKIGRIIPVYPTTYGLTQNAIRQLVENALLMVHNKLKETLPDYLIEEYKLLDLEESLNKIHFPENIQSRLKARERLVFEELLTLQLALLELKGQTEENNGISFNKKVKMSEIINTIPFKLTKAQLRVLEEIDKDMESNKSMNRLLQGDVGSRKNNCINSICI